MLKSHKLFLAVLAAALLLSSAVTTASARNLSVSNTRFRIVWANLDFQSGIGVDIECRVTLEGSFHRATIAKVERSLIGAITSAAVSHPCAGGEGWANNGRENVLGRTAIQSLPWHITYEDFAGTLPTITSIDLLLRRALFTISIEGICLADYGIERDNITGRIAIEAGGNATNLTPVEGQNRATLQDMQSGFFCPNPGTLVGPGRVTLAGNDTPIRVTLIA